MSRRLPCTCGYCVGDEPDCPVHGNSASPADIAPVLHRALAESRAVEHDIRLSRVDVRNLVELTAEWNADRAAHNYGPPITLEGALSRLLQTTRDMVARKVT